MPNDIAPSRVARAVVSVCIGVLSALFARSTAHVHGAKWVAGDFTYWWRGARALLDGQSPYAVIRPAGAYPLEGFFAYPLTNALIATPLAPLQPVTGLIVFSGLSGALLAWVVTRDGYYRLPMFVGPSFLWCASGGQWVTLLTAAALTPGLSWLATVKPNIGLAALAYRPSRLAVGLNLAALVVAVAVRPTWIAEWLRVLAELPPGMFSIPALSVAGPVIVLSALRWRRAEARLLLVLACVPQSLMFYDQLPLWLVPATLAESALLTLIATVAREVWGRWAAAAVFDPLHGVSLTAVLEPRALPLFSVMLYLPCALMVLRRPNEGPAPAWLERALARWRVPKWLSGFPSGPSRT